MRLVQGRCVREFHPELACQCVARPPRCCSMSTAPQVLQGTKTRADATLTSTALENLDEHHFPSNLDVFDLTHPISSRCQLRRRYQRTLNISDLESLAADLGFIVVETNLLLAQSWNPSAIRSFVIATRHRLHGSLLGKHSAALRILQLLSLPQPPPNGIPLWEYLWQWRTPIWSLLPSSSVGLAGRECTSTILGPGLNLLSSSYPIW